MSNPVRNSGGGAQTIVRFFLALHHLALYEGIRMMEVYMVRVPTTKMLIVIIDNISGAVLDKTFFSPIGAAKYVGALNKKTAAPVGPYNLPRYATAVYYWRADPKHATNACPRCKGKVNSTAAICLRCGWEPDSEQCTRKHPHAGKHKDKAGHQW